MKFTRYIFYFITLWIMSNAANAFDVVLEDKNLQDCILQLKQQKQWSTIAAVTEIECHNKNIRTLAGIEKFTQLKKISLYNNEITEAKLSNLPNLQHLNLAKNKMHDLSISDFQALESLYAFGNKLTRLKLSNLPKLQQIKANDNLIVEFHYQDLPALEKMYLFNNKMVDMDIYHLPLARYIDIRQNPMPDKLYEEMDKLKGITFLHDGNAKDWQ
ncbi:MAG: leucine-rich repeat domain-containing protein [Pseudomonadota bacterium]